MMIDLSSCLCGEASGPFPAFDKNGGSHTPASCCADSGQCRCGAMRIPKAGDYTVRTDAGGYIHGPEFCPRASVPVHTHPPHSAPCICGSPPSSAKASKQMPASGAPDDSPDAMIVRNERLAGAVKLLCVAAVDYAKAEGSLTVAKQKSALLNAALQLAKEWK